MRVTIVAVLAFKNAITGPPKGLISTMIHNVFS